MLGFVGVSDSGRAEDWESASVGIVHIAGVFGLPAMDKV